jgi:hypothetical protein
MRTISPFPYADFTAVSVCHIPDQSHGQTRETGFQSGGLFGSSGVISETTEDGVQDFKAELVRAEGEVNDIEYI